MMSFFLFSAVAIACTTCTQVSSGDVISASTMQCVMNEINCNATSCSIPWSLGTLSTEIVTNKPIRTQHIAQLHNGIRRLLGYTTDGVILPSNINLLPGTGRGTLAAGALPPGIEVSGSLTDATIYSTFPDPASGVVISAAAINSIIADANNIQCALGCTPTTCPALGFNCGNFSDGCGGTLNCGSCGTNEVCTNGVCTCSKALDCGVCGGCDAYCYWPGTCTCGGGPLGPGVCGCTATSWSNCVCGFSQFGGGCNKPCGVGEGWEMSNCHTFRICGDDTTPEGCQPGNVCCNGQCQSWCPPPGIIAPVV